MVNSSKVTTLVNALLGKFALKNHTHTVANISNASAVAVTVTYTDSTTEVITFLKQS